MVKTHNKQSVEKRPTGVGWTIAIVVVIVLGIVFALTSSNNKVDYTTYNGFAFETDGTYWQTVVQFEGEHFEVPFYNHPRDVEPILYNEEITDFLLRTPHQILYISISPDGGSVPVLAGVNIARITGKIYELPTKSALYTTNTTLGNETGFETKTCADATQLRPVIHIQNNASISGAYYSEENPNCIIISGTDKDELFRITDIVGYKLLGIIPPAK